ncbi:DUF218 domain-containing protein [Oceanobacillus limi]|uniref:DUF218 domain-containing protein n=1 Tax=Oceanobacillus limi TaxID=930131 RepID=A0A1I0D4E1_9BACI|nr:YdcF family protein [Oceanobacillus limi]SET27005.1 DUF218 domain-containing protein [Oceanobacillus limi]
MLLSSINLDKLSREQKTSLIFDGTEDDGIQGDCILLFGDRSSSRSRKAADLFLKKRAPYIIVSGSGNRWGDNETPEAIWMKGQLLNFGVPEDKIFLELEADNTTENVLGAAYVLEKKIGLHRIKRILIVSAPFHVKRCYLTLRTYMPNWIDYSFCPDDRKRGRKHNWWTDPKEEKTINKEIASLIRYTNMGILNDVDIKDL